MHWESHARGGEKGSTLLEMQFLRVSNKGGVAWWCWALAILLGELSHLLFFFYLGTTHERDKGLFDQRVWSPLMAKKSCRPIPILKVSSRKWVLESEFSKVSSRKWVLESEFSKVSSRKWVLESEFLKPSSWKRVLKGKFSKTSARKRVLESEFSKASSRKLVLESESLKASSWKRVLEGSS
jgi:hypothetical protein